MDCAAMQNLMQEQMRGNDVAMRNIESMPGGYNALRSMFETVNGAQNAQSAPADGDATANASANPLQAMLSSLNLQQQGSPGSAGSSGSQSTDRQAGAAGPNAAPLPNPWQPDTSTQGGAAGGLPAGLGGLAGLSGLGGAGGGNPAAMMQNPQMRSMMTSMMSNPAMLDAMAAQNPQMRAMLDNPHMRAMLTNPQFVDRMMRPEVRGNA
jgi:ubiquilin